MTTPDAQARLLGGAIESQRRQQEVARDAAREIERDRQRERESESEREPE